MIRRPKAAIYRMDAKVKATLHWVSAAHAVSAEVRRFEHLFRQREPRRRRGPDRGRQSELDDGHCEARIEPALAADAIGTQVQFERLGYFCVDPDSKRRSSPSSTRS